MTSLSHRDILMLMIETVLLTSSFCMSSGGSSTKSYKNILLFIILGTPLKIDIGGEGGQILSPTLKSAFILQYQLILGIFSPCQTILKASLNIRKESKSQS